MKVKKYVFNSCDEWNNFTMTLYGYSSFLTKANRKWLEKFSNQYRSFIFEAKPSEDFEAYIALGPNYKLYVLNDSFWIESYKENLTGYLISDTREAKDVGNFIKEKFNPEHVKATVEDVINYLKENFSLAANVRYDENYLDKNEIHYMFDKMTNNDNLIVY